MLKKFWSWFLTGFGKIGLVRQEPRLTGKQIEEIITLVQPGDIIGRTFDLYLDNWLIPGDLDHSSIYIGDNKIIHSVAPCVEEINIIDFLRGADYAGVLRPNYLGSIVERAKSALGKPYDFMFSKDESEFYCHELTAWCLGVVTTTRFITWDDIAKHCKLIYKSF